MSDVSGGRNGFDQAWHRLWPALSTGAAIWAVFYALVISPLQQTDRDVKEMIRVNAEKIVSLQAGEADAIRARENTGMNLRTLRDDLRVGIEDIRKDMELAIGDRNERLRGLDNKIVRLEELLFRHIEDDNFLSVAKLMSRKKLLGGPPLRKKMDGESK